MNGYRTTNALHQSASGELKHRVIQCTPNRAGMFWTVYAAIVVAVVWWLV